MAWVSIITILASQPLTSTEDANRRLQFHTRNENTRIRQSKRVAERLALAVIDTSSLVPMTVNAKVQEQVTTCMTSIKELLQRTVFSLVPGEPDRVIREVQIPVWVHKSVLKGRENDTSMTLEQLEATNTEMWLSITELRRCNLNVPATRGHHYEWLACGHIPLLSIKNVVPFDGNKLYWDRSRETIRSSYGENHWIWDFDKRMWVLDLEWERLKEEERKATMSEKGLRQRGSEDAPSEDDAESGVFDSDHEKVPTNRKRKANKEIGRMEKRNRLENDEPVADAPACTRQCTVCCQLGYTDQEAQYAMAWEAFVNSSNCAHNGTASDKEA